MDCGDVADAAQVQEDSLASVVVNGSALQRELGGSSLEAKLSQLELHRSPSGQSTRTSTPVRASDVSSILGACSVGSNLHGSGQCRPCAWFWKPEGCKNGADCCHCHTCPADEIKNRKQAKHFAMNQIARRPRVATGANGRSSLRNQSKISGNAQHARKNAEHANLSTNQGLHDVSSVASHHSSKTFEEMIMSSKKAFRASYKDNQAKQSALLSTTPLVQTRPGSSPYQLALAPGLVPPILGWSEPVYCKLEGSYSDALPGL